MSEETNALTKLTEKFGYRDQRPQSIKVFLEWPKWHCHCKVHCRCKCQ